MFADDNSVFLERTTYEKIIEDLIGGAIKVAELLSSNTKCWKKFPKDPELKEIGAILYWKDIRLSKPTSKFLGLYFR